MRYKKIIAILMLIPVMLTCFACGNSAANDGSNNETVNIEGDLQEIMSQIYADLDGVDAERKETMQGYITDVLTEDNEQAMLGTEDIDYIEGIVSVPMISAIAYQCVLLRVNPDDVEDIKQKLKDNADLNKWVCVSAETVLVENVGDVILFIMSDQDVAYAVSSAFQSLGK